MDEKVIYFKIKTRCENAFRFKFKIYDDDVIYDAMLDIILKYKKNKENIRNFDTWLNGAIHNHFRAFLRKKKMNKEFLFDHGDDSEIASEISELNLTSAELFDLIKQLNDHQQTVVALRIFENLPNKEIAKKLDVTVENIKVTYFRAIKKIGTIINKHVTFLMFFLPLIWSLLEK